MYERTLDRRVSFDPKSRSFPIRAVIPAAVVKPRSYTWSCAFNLDQGSEGACVGFAWAHELGARPVVVAESSNMLAQAVYKEAQKIDEWPGESYSGTSVLAGAKIILAHRWMDEYRWAFGLDDLIMAVGYKGPAVLGVNWHTGMFSPDQKGYIHATGNVEGGHAILCRAVNIKQRRFLLHNSWGADWGPSRGTAWIDFEDMDKLLHESGEACVPVRRRQSQWPQAA